MPTADRHHRTRWFFAAHLQGALGTGAGYVALLLLAYEQLGSAWGATAVLLADLAPAMLLGPLLGGLIDRTSRLGCAIAADVLGALAFAGLVFAHGAAQLIALALLAGLGSALFRPATCALLPAIVDPKHLSKANGTFGAVREIGQLIGPALAAGVLLIAVARARARPQRPHLRGLRPPAHPPQGPPQPAPEPSAEDAAPTNTKSVLKDRLTRSLVLTSGAVMLVAGATNVAELVLAKNELTAAPAASPCSSRPSAAACSPAPCSPPSATRPCAPAT